MSANTYELEEVTFYLVNTRTGAVARKLGFRLPGKQRETTEFFYIAGDTTVYSSEAIYNQIACATKEQVVQHLERWATARRKELGEVYRWLESEVGRS